MTVSNSVFIQIKSQSLVQIIKTLDLLTQNNISFNIIEGQQPKNVAASRNNIPNLKILKSIGSKGENILKLLSEGCTYNEIAEQTDITVDGVRYHIKKIFKFFGVNNSRDAIRVYLTEMNVK